MFYICWLDYRLIVVRTGVRYITDMIVDETFNFFKGCDATHYGANCSYECSVNCNQQSCNITSGSCSLGCKTGYYGDHCSKLCGGCLEGCHRHTGKCEGACPFGKFGAHCERTCSQTCKGECTKTSGVCTSCMDGWYGDTCNETCSAGCSLRCDQVDGNCTCKPGWEGYDCRGMRILLKNVLSWKSLNL